jgi:hypothetical protein
MLWIFFLLMDINEDGIIRNNLIVNDNSYKLLIFLM